MGGLSMSMVRGEGVNRLPDDIAASVGHIAHQFALLEEILKLCIYKLAGVSNTVGRIAIGTGRADSQVSKIEDLMTDLGYAFDPSLTEFKKAVTKAELDRDSVIHGNWAKDPENGDLILLDLKGSWNIGPNKPRMTRRMYPAGRATNNQDLINIHDEIKHVARMAWRVYKQLPTSPDKPASPSEPDHPSSDQSENKPPDPQAPSRE